MPSVQYKVYTRYFNENRNECITNNSNIEWRQRTNENWEPFSNDKYENGEYDNAKATNEIFEFFTMPEDLANVGEEVIVSSEERARLQDEQIKRIQNITLHSNSANNEKYDMLFYYTGINFTFADPDKRLPSILCDCFERTKGSPWFEYSTHASLNSAMEKAKSLINKIGKNNVRIGKVIPLEQYIEIV